MIASPVRPFVNRLRGLGGARGLGGLRGARRLRRLLPVALAWGTLLAGAGCGTVDLGDPPADVNACRPSRAYFLSDVWGGFLDKDYGGQKCGDSRCHDPTSGRQFVVSVPKSAPVLPLPADWEANYISASMQMQCSDVKGSPLYTRASGLQTHGPGKLIEPAGPEALILEAWVTAP